MRDRQTDPWLIGCRSSVIKSTLQSQCGLQLHLNFRTLTLSNRNLEDAIMEAYKFLSNAYEDGDRIYLFGTSGPAIQYSTVRFNRSLSAGYSRGAYQVRVLAGMIEKAG
jgi:uncharacterized protein (DUF2235 family)